MYKLYNDTEKELFFDDYKPLPTLYKLSITDLVELIENLENACENACMYGSALLENALYDDIVIVKRYTLSTIIKSYSSGTISGYINNTKYVNIDNAINKTLYYIFNCDDQDIYQLSVDNETIKNLVIECYTNKRKPEVTWI